MVVNDCIYEIDNSIDFLKIYDGSRSYYGGNQEWFKDPTLKRCGCSIVAAANITAYMAKKRTTSQLYNYKDMSKDSFTYHMNKIAEFLKPDALKGVTSVSYFNDKVIEFSKTRGVILKANVVTIEDSIKDIKAFIKKALLVDKPIAMLMLKNAELQEFEWHWMTITKLFENKEKTYLDFSTWGERRIFTLENFYKYSSYGALIYFDII